MIVHWGQLLATAGTLTGCGAAVSACVYPFSRRREQRKIDALKVAATAATAELKETVGGIVTAAVSEVKADVLARVGESHESTSAILADLKQNVEKIAEAQTATTLKIATEFGGNGNGIRQAINGMKEDVAELKGKFTQHVIEAKG